MQKSLSSIATDRQEIQDHCGIVAAFATGDITFFERGITGLSILQTRGYDGAGFWAQSSWGQTYQYKGIGMVNEVFDTNIRDQFRQIAGRTWIYQVRYGTSGAFNQKNVQPIELQHLPSKEYFAIAHNGQFAQETEEQEDVSDTVRFAQQLANHSANNWEGRIIDLLSRKKGAWSLVIGTKNGLFIARDQLGIRPLAYGHLVDPHTKANIWVVASETSALEAVGILDYFELLPGMIAKITDAGLALIHKTGNGVRAHCIFENVYIQHGGSRAHMPRNNPRKINTAQTIDDVRRRSGKILAREAPLTAADVDIVIGVPGTGIAGGMTYALSLDLPYFQAITDKAVRSQEQRTFMTAKIDSIYQKVLDHFNFDSQTLKNRRVCLVDDSIVRGNITKGLVYLLREKYGVTAVHIRVLSPAIDKACHLGLNTRSSEELIAAKFFGSIDKIRENLLADSLAYLSSSGLKEAITSDPEAPGFCMGCMVGQTYPIDRSGHPSLIRRKRMVKRNGFYAHV